MLQALSPLASAGINTRATPSSTVKAEKQLNGFENRPLGSSPSKRKDQFIDIYQEKGSSSPFESLVSQEENLLPSNKHSPSKTAPAWNTTNPTKTAPTFRESTSTEHKMDESMIGMDDSCLSMFSVVPGLDVTRMVGNREPSSNTTTFSPSKQLQGEHNRYNISSTPGTLRMAGERSSSPTPRGKHPSSDDSQTSDNLLEFTGQSNLQFSPTKSRRSPIKSHTHNDLASYLSRGRTPSPHKNTTRVYDPSALANLLDFEIPPAPTPRSLPTITAREMESMKSAYLSEISSLKATLNGKVAEVSSLKEAVGDAESRVGEALEQLRDEKGRLESLQTDKDNWEQRGREMEDVLRRIKEEMLERAEEKESLQSKLDDSEKRREEAELKAQEAESQLAGMRSVSSSHGDSTPRSQSKRDMDIAERVSRELHTAYKQKHDTKVAALKKSYQSRWEKKVKDLETRLEETTKEVEDLRTTKDASLTDVIPSTIKDEGQATCSESERATAIQMAEEQKAKVKGLQEELQSIKNDNHQLRSSLEMERIEKGELVAVVEEWLRIQSAAPVEQASASGGLEAFRTSVSRSSGLRGPGFSRIAGGGGSAAAPEPGKERGLSHDQPSRTIGHSKSNSNLAAPRSGIMSNIERMARGRGDE